jgi:hypothetical protein
VRVAGPVSCTSRGRSMVPRMQAPGAR